MQRRQVVTKEGEHKTGSSPQKRSQGIWQHVRTTTQNGRKESKLGLANVAQDSARRFLHKSQYRDNNVRTWLCMWPSHAILATVIYRQ